MPRQPFPSYNVYDYHDITLSYGDADGLRLVVEAAHAHGMRVILDILMQGAIDEKMITATAERVRDKIATLPKVSITARHIDSHDSFWWPLPGFKWRREQYGIPATRALVATWSLSGGVYMMFVGGEVGIEEDIRRVNRLRHTIPEIRLDAADYGGIAVADERVYAVARVLDEQRSLVLVNLSGETVPTTCAFADLDGLNSPTGYILRDVWRDESLRYEDGYSWFSAQSGAINLTFAPHQVRVLKRRPAR